MLEPTRLLLVDDHAVVRKGLSAFFEREPGIEAAGEAEMVLLSREGSGVTIAADGDATVLVLTGAPIDEPIAGYGPFVMNSRS
mgnify:CR=1 FL=1